MAIKVLLVDDQMLVREGIKSLLQLSDKVTVVGEASDGSEVNAAVTNYQPEVILMDLSMPVMNGIDALKALNDMACTIPVIILTTFDDHQFILQALSAGAKGYLLKDVSLETLIEGIETVHQGKKLVQPAITERLLKGLNEVDNKDKKPFAAPEIIENLSTKEIEVLGLMASGCSNKEISEALNKSTGTIKNHVSNILAKLGVRDRTRAVLLAIEKGILSVK